METSDWEIVGASLLGRAHLESDLPCQDAHRFEILDGAKGIALVSDGAGSCENSHLGSGFVIEKVTERIKEQDKVLEWLDENHILNEEEWSDYALSLVSWLREELNGYAREEELSYKSLSCTLILALFSPYRILTLHVGDGRAGYADAEGSWKNMMTPFKGEQVGQTVFVTSGDNDQLDSIVESRVVDDVITGITLMSDGCELACWKCYEKLPEENQYHDPNEPYQKFFEQTTGALKSMHLDGLSQDDIMVKWAAFLENGNEALTKEMDDKTMILGVLINQEEVETPSSEGHEADHPQR